MRLAAIFCGVLYGCAIPLGTIPAVMPVATPGFKMIRPGARAESCRWVVLGSSQQPDPVGQALAVLGAVDAEVDTFRSVELRETGWTLGLLARQCVVVTADLGRAIPIVEVPMDHSQHHHH